MTIGMPEISIEVDFAAGDGALIGDPDRGKIGTATIGNPNSYVDISADVRRGRVVRGFSQFSGIYARSTAGSLTVLLDNTSADYDPTNLSGPYVSGGVTQVQPRRQVRLYGPSQLDASVIDLDVASVVGDVSTFPASLADVVDYRTRLLLPEAFSSLTLGAVRRTSGEDIELSYVSGALTLVVDNSGGTPIDSYSVTTDWDDWALTSPTWIRFVFDADTGSGSSCTFYRSADGETWELLGSDTSVTAHATTSFDNAYFEGASGLLFYKGEIYNATLPVASVDVSSHDPSPTAYSFLDSVGGSWQVDAGDAVIASERVPTWAGWVQRWEPDYPAGQDREATTTMNAIDAIGTLSRIDGREQSSQGGGEDTGARIGRILDQAEWPAGARDIDTGIATVQATTLAQNAWSEIQLTSDTELGEVYVDGRGWVVFRNRHATILESRSANVQAVFGDRVDLGEIPITAVSVSYDDEQIWNDAQIARAGGSAVQVQNLTSIGIYGINSFTRSDLIHQTDAESESFGRYIVGLFGAPQLRVEQVTLNARHSVESRYECFRREIGDRIQVKIRPPGRTSDPIVRDCFIRGITHEFDYLTLTWVTSFALQDASDRWDVAIVGEAVIGTHRIGF